MFFRPFRPRLHSKFVKSATMIKCFFFQKRNLCIKNAEFDAYFESIEKVVIKTQREKVINEKVREKWSFVIITECNSFQPITILCTLFCTFLNGFELSIKFCVL